MSVLLGLDQGSDTSHRLVMGDVGAWIVEALLDAIAKPAVVVFGLFLRFELRDDRV
jgi:hypothetical protein